MYFAINQSSHERSVSQFVSFIQSTCDSSVKCQNRNAYDANNTLLLTNLKCLFGIP